MLSWDRNQSHITPSKMRETNIKKWVTLADQKKKLGFLDSLGNLNIMAFC